MEKEKFHSAVEGIAYSLLQHDVYHTDTETTRTTSRVDGSPRSNIKVKGWKPAQRALLIERLLRRDNVMLKGVSGATVTVEYKGW